MKHLRLFFIYTLFTLTSISSVYAEENLTGMDRVYLVITTSDMVEAFTTLTNYRETDKGGNYTTYIETMDFIETNYEGIDRAEKVRNYIKNSHKNHGTRFVILGGDADGEMENHKVPMRGIYNKYEADDKVIAEDAAVPSDRYYAYLDGSFNSDGDENWGEENDGADLFPENKNLDWGYEVAVGRIAADNSEEAFNHINKIIAFEQLDLPGKSLLAGQKINDQPTWGADNLDRLMVCNDSTKAYDRDLEFPWTRAEMITLINSNQYSQLHHSGHADFGAALRMNVSDIPNLSNQHPMFIYTQGDYAATVSHDDSFAEIITNGYPNGGAAAFIGSSSQTWLDEGYGDSAFAHQMFQEFQYYSDYHIGVALLIADLELRYGGYSNPGRWATFSTVLIGDPATRIYNQTTGSKPKIDSFSGTTLYENDIANGINIRAVATDEDYDLHTVTVFLDGKALLTSTIDRRASDTTSFPLSFAELTSGEHCVSARADDVFANFSPMSEEVCFTVKEQVAPVITDVEINTLPEDQEVVVRVIDNDQDVDQVECTFDGSMTTNAIKTLDDVEVTIWKCNIPDLLLDREHQVTIQATDEAGLSSDISGPHMFHYNHSPELTVNIDTNIGETASITGTATDIDGDLDIIRMRFNSSNYWVTATGTENYSFEAHLRPGKHSVIIEALDMRDNSISIEKDFTVTAACTKYTSTNLEHESAGRAYTKTETTGGYCWGSFCWGQEQTTTWYAKGSNNSMGTSGEDETTLSKKEDGYYSVGNCSANSYAPIATIANWEVQDGKLILTGTATDPNSDLKGVTLKGDGVSENCTLNGSTFNCSIDGLIDGDYSFYVTAYDMLGNISTPSNTVSFNIGAINNCITATNYQHSQDGRAYTGGALNLYAFAQGSSDELGLLGSSFYSSATSLRETSKNHWEMVGNCN